MSEGFLHMRFGGWGGILGRAYFRRAFYQNFTVFLSNNWAAAVERATPTHIGRWEAV